VWAVNEYQKQADKFFKIFAKLYVAYLVVGLLPHLPDELAGKIVNKLLGMIGLG
jgi:hypothetical protein